MREDTQAGIDGSSERMPTGSMAADSSTPIDDFLRGQPGLAAALSGIDRAAASSAPVLLIGEAGLGKTTLARAIHDASPRRDGPRVEFDPGALPPELFESGLFGHRVGAFTGASMNVPGAVRRAEMGSLILDRVEEIPLGSQPKLLRLLAERRYSPLGGDEAKADVRFLAIGAEDLPRRVEGGSFRSDLFYRLEVLAFRLPSLRERRQDLPTLIDGLLHELAVRLERPVLELSDRARRWMLGHSWPGNLRQLRNLLEREAVLTQAGEVLDPASLAPGPRPRSLREVEEEAIRVALVAAQGHQGRAAEILGISRKSLWERRRRFGLK